MGQPQDIEGECNEHLYIADGYGDNEMTMRCQLPKGHEGGHREIFTRDTSGKIIITWERSERCWHEWVGIESELAAAYYLSVCEGDLEAAERQLEEEREVYGGEAICKKCGDFR